MKKLTLVLMVGFVAGALLMHKIAEDRHARALSAARAAWEVERSNLEGRNQLPRRSSEPRLQSAPQGPSEIAVDPRELINRLAALEVPPPGPGQGRALRQVVAILEQLTQLGSVALAPIQEFLASGQEVTYETAVSKRSRDLPALVDSITPVSLRFGLFDAVRRIGGETAEKILTDAAEQTQSGFELAYLAHLLDELAPGEYADLAMRTARSLLARSDLTSMDRDFLFGILRRLKDASYVTAAEGQLIQTDGKLDRNALRYLQDSLGDQSIALAARLYNDPAITDADSREPLARLALAYVGTNAAAAELYHKAVLDLTLDPDHRRNLVEDLNQDGLMSKRHPTPEDLVIIARRYELTQAYLQQDYVKNDKLLFEAFKEADKDLRNMLSKAAAEAAAAK